LTPRDRILLAVRLLGGQRNLARKIPTHDRNVRRWIAGYGKPSAEAQERAREALERRRGEIEEALAGWDRDVISAQDYYDLTTSDPCTCGAGPGDDHSKSCSKRRQEERIAARKRAAI